MNLLRRLIPPFLQRWDLWLQQHMPRLWATRIHYHVWFLLVVDALVCALGLVLHVGPRKFPDPQQLFLYMVLPAVIYFACWVYKVVLFTVERRFGIRHTYAEVGEFLLHFVSIALILTIPYTLSLTVAFRIDHLVDDATFVEQINTLNTQSPWFYGDQRNYTSDDEEEQGYADPLDREVITAVQAVQQGEGGHRTQGDGTHEFFHSLDEYAHRHDLERGGFQGTELPLHNIYDAYMEGYVQASDRSDEGHYDPDTAAYFLQKADSIERHFPLFFVRFGMFTPSTYYGWSPPGLLSDSLLEVRYIADQRARRPMDKAAIARAIGIAHIYAAGVRQLSPDSVAKAFELRLPSNVGLTGAAEQITEIARAKALHYDVMDWRVLVYGFGITCFVLALLVSIFKNIYWQPFLLMVVTGILLPIVVFLFALLTERSLFNAGADKVMIWSYYAIAVYLIGMLFRVPSLRVYRTRNAVMTILGNLALPFFAVFTLLMLHEELDVFGLRALRDRMYELPAGDPTRIALELQAGQLDERIQLIMVTTLWAGLVVYVFVLHPLVRNLYTRLMALPERK